MDNLTKQLLELFFLHVFFCMPSPIPDFLKQVFQYFLLLFVFFIYFRLFKQTLQFLQQTYVKKCHDHPVFGAGIRTYDLWNTSTRPGLPPYYLFSWVYLFYTGITYPKLAVLQ